MAIIFIILSLSGAVLGLWNDLNCPAPRSPENGLNFIFSNGELVHFRCHPGYMMKGKAVAYCINSQWTAPAPECIPIRKGANHAGVLGLHDDSHYYSHQQTAHVGGDKQRDSSPALSREEMNKKLFNWDNKSRKKGVYGDGPRRVPLINGIWPEQEVKLMALGPQSTPGPMELVREEVNIAELRNKQYEEVAQQRRSNANLDLLPAKSKRRKGNKKRKKHKTLVANNDVMDSDSRKTLISLGTTEDGDALSVSYVKPSNDSDEVGNATHKRRHRDPRKKKRKEKGKKWRNNQYPYYDNVIARSSRVDTSGLTPYNVRRYGNKVQYGKNEVAEFRRLPIQQVRGDKSSENELALYDTSCVESFYGRDVPMIAPQVKSAFVYRYETKKNKEFPFNSYMQVKYRCLSGYAFADARIQALSCREATWVGEVPRCVEQRG